MTQPNICRLTLYNTVYMQVCNHPDLFEGRPIVSSFDMWGLPFHLPSLAMHALRPSKWASINLSSINADVLAQEADSAWAAQRRHVSHAVNPSVNPSVNPCVNHSVKPFCAVL